MFCRKCGSELPENVRFCPKCGTLNVNERMVSKESKGTKIKEYKRKKLIVGIVGGCLLVSLLFLICVSYSVTEFTRGGLRYLRRDDHVVVNGYEGEIITEVTIPSEVRYWVKTYPVTEIGGFRG